MSLRNVLCLSAVILLACAVLTAHADVPQLINYQGLLLDSNGDPVTTPVNITFAIWNAETDGDSLWSETQLVTPDDLARFNVFLGSVSPVPDSAFAGSAYLGMTVESDLEMSPRARLVSVPHAYRVGTVDGASGGQVTGDLTVTGSVGIGTTNPESIKLVVQHDDNWAARFLNSNGADVRLAYKDGNGIWVNSSITGSDNSLIALKSAGISRFHVLNDGNVGIGTTSPSVKLDVVSSEGIPGDIRSYAAETNFTELHHGQIIIRNNGSGASLLDADHTGTASTLVDIRDNGSSAFHIANGGNVGIGTDNPHPLYKLDIAGGSSSGIILGPKSPTGSEGGELAFRDKNGNTKWIIDDNSDDDLRISAYQSSGGGNILLLPLGNGNVGIGLTTPAYKLEVAGDINAKSGNLLAQNGLGFLDGIQLAIRGRTGGLGRMLVDEGGWITMNYNYDFPGGVQLYGQLRHHGEILQQLNRIRDLGSPVDPNDAATKAYVDAQVGGGSGYWAASGSNIYSVNSGNVGVGTSNPEDKLHVNGGGIRIGHPGEVNIDASGIIGGRLKILDNGNVGIGTTSPSTKLDVREGGAGAAVYAESYSTLSNVGAVTGRAKADGGSGVYGETWSLGVSGGSSVGVYGWAPASGAAVGGAALGVLGKVNSYQDPNNSSVPSGVFGWATAGSGINAGVWGETNSPDGFGVYSKGNLAVDGNFNCNGTKNAIVPTSDGDRALYCQESPEVWFEDFGEAQLNNGQAHVELDGIFLETVTTNEKHPMKVFVTLNDDCKGVYVKRGLTGFDVLELGNGKSNARFTYRVVAKRKGFEDLRLELSRNEFALRR